MTRSLLPSAAPCPGWAACRRWALDLALPLWAEAGFDPARGVFQERLSLTRLPLPEAPRRVMVQARQIYVYATAARLGWLKGGDALAAQAARGMLRDYRRDDGGWAFSVDSKGREIDGKRDLYAQAFALFGLAAVYKLTGEAHWLDHADKTLAFLDAHMALPEGGYVTEWPGPGPFLLQNPHMHLLESLLALHDCDASRGYAERADKIVSLFTHKFFQKKTGTLSEYFGPGWSPAPGDKGRLFEPGHHYEWIWLLDAYDTATGKNTADLRAALARTAQKWGTSPAGLIYAEIRDDGEILNDSSRAWPHTEAVKATLAAPDLLGGPQVADSWLSTLYDRFLKPAHPGGWIDHLDAEGRPQSPFMPASTFYHIMMALSERARRLGDLP